MITHARGLSGGQTPPHALLLLCVAALPVSVDHPWGDIPDFLRKFLDEVELCILRTLCHARRRLFVGLCLSRQRGPRTGHRCIALFNIRTHLAATEGFHAFVSVPAGGTVALHMLLDSYEQSRLHC